MNLGICERLVFAVFAITGLLGAPQALAQNAYVTNAGDNTVSVIDTATNTVTATIPVAGGPVAVALDPDGRRIYIANGDDTVSVIDAATIRVIATIPHVGGAVAVSPDGSKVFAEFVDPASNAPAVAVINTATNKVTTTIPVVPFPSLTLADSAVVSADGKRLYFVLHNNLIVIDTETNAVIANLGGGNYNQLAVTPDGTKLYLTRLHCNAACPLAVIDTTTNTLVTEISGDGFQFNGGVAVTTDGSKVYAVTFTDCGCTPETVFIIDTATDSVIGTISLPMTTGFGANKGLSVTPDGGKVYVADNVTDTVSVIEAATNAMIATIPVGSNPQGVVIPMPTSRSAPPAGSLCNGIYEGTFPGDLIVSPGQDCIFLGGGRIDGNVWVVGGNFALNGSTIRGDLTIGGRGTYTLGPGATVEGNLAIQNIPPGSANNSVCGATVYGNMVVNSDGTAVQIGSAEPLFCGGNTVGGNLEVFNNSNSALMLDNLVGGNMLVLDNRGLVDVVSNTVRGVLLCRDNPDLQMGSGNTAGRKIGQCN